MARANLPKGWSVVPITTPSVAPLETANPLEDLILGSKSYVFVIGTVQGRLDDPLSFCKVQGLDFNNSIIKEFTNKETSWTSTRIIAGVRAQFNLALHIH